MMHTGPREESKGNPKAGEPGPDMLSTLLSGKQEGASANPFEKYGINISISSLLQLPPDRFAEITKNLNSQSKDGPFTGREAIS